MYIPSELPTDANIDELAAKYDGVTGSDISNAVFMAAIKAARENSDSVIQNNFEEAIKQLIQAKKDNSKENFTITKRVVSEDYVKEQLGKKEI